MPAEIIGGQLSLPDGTALPLSKGVRAGDFIFLSGQLGLDENGRVAEGIEAQTRHCLRNIGDATEDVKIYGPSAPLVSRFRQRNDYASLWTFGIKGTW